MCLADLSSRDIDGASIDTVLRYATALRGGPVFGNRVGASESEISALAALCPHPLPTLYLDFLREFGVNSDGLDLGFDTISDVESVIRHHQDGLPAQSGQTGALLFPFALQGGDVEYAFDYAGASSGASPQPYVSACSWYEFDYFVARTFQNFLFSCVFHCVKLSGRIARAVFRVPNPQDVGLIAEAFLKLGFSLLPFSDEFRGFYQREEAVITIFHSVGYNSLCIWSDVDSDVRTAIVHHEHLRRLVAL